jgi:hypothetical protein
MSRQSEPNQTPRQLCRNSRNGFDETGDIDLNRRRQSSPGRDGQTHVICSPAISTHPRRRPRRAFNAVTASVGLTYLLISCARPRAPRSDAARPLPRLTMHSEEVICNGRDAVAPEVTEELQLRST